MIDPEGLPWDDNELVIIPAEDLAKASFAEQEAYFQYLVEKTKEKDEWEPWLKMFLPEFASKTFSAGHREFWDWVWSIELEDKPQTWVSIWPRGFAKALAIDTPLPGPDGRKLMGDVQPGDRLFDETGATCTVTGISPIEVKSCYRVHFEGGNYIDASGDHLWSVIDRRSRRVMHGAEGTIPLTWASWKHSDRPGTPCDICGVRKAGSGPNGENWCSMHLKRWKKFGDPLQRGSRKRQRTALQMAEVAGRRFSTSTLTTEEMIPLTDSEVESEYGIRVAGVLQYEPSESLRVDPWLLGLWLGDGSKANGSITVGYQDSEETVRRIQSHWTGDVTVINRDNDVCVNPLGLNSMLKSMGLRGNKHIPTEYLSASESDRRALLAGLMDSDGSAENGAAVFSNTNKALVDGVFELASGLGFRATVTSCRAKLYEKDCGPAWRVRVVAPPADVFCLSRKKAAAHAEYMALNPLLHLVNRIERLPDQPVRCIVVDSPNHLFLAGPACIPTHNSTSTEMAVTALGARNKRKYVLYVCEVQEQADDHVANIAAMMEGATIELGYENLGTPAVTKAGNTKGWRRNRIISATGFIVDACGLDSAARGIKFEAQRPDMIIFDDIDGELDTELITKKKIKVITQKLLPAGAPNCATLLVQNLVHENSIFAQLADNRADFLKNRIVSGPIPAVFDLEVEQRDLLDEDGEVAGNTWVIIGGEPSWAEGFPLLSCQALINEFGLTAFLSECQHETRPPDGEIFSHLVFAQADFEDLPIDKEGRLKFKRCVVWVDPAVTSKDTSDSMGIQCDALGYDGKVYRLWSWEQRSSPYKALKLAIRKAIELGADTVGVETNQGGDTWRFVYDQAMDDTRKEIEEEGGDFFRKMPKYKEANATKDLGSKIVRAERMLVDYERFKFIHVRGTHVTLERALNRFPRQKPLDLVDACLAPETLVATPDGPRRLDEIAIGDLVETRLGSYPVSEAGMTGIGKDLIEIRTASSHSLIGTEDHPVWTQEMGWTPMSETAGLYVRLGPLSATSIQPEQAAMSLVETVKLLGTGNVWNLEVDGPHEYFANGILVHNCYWSWSELAGPLRRRKMKMSGAARMNMGQSMGVRNAPHRGMG